MCDQVPSINIIGAGPAGLFAAQAMRRSRPDARIDVIDRLPTPYGLVRYGVAPDHQGTKRVTRQFDRVFETGLTRFFGGVTVGVDVSLGELRRMYDAVIVASGLYSDRLLSIPGEGKGGLLRAGKITRWFNSHPDARDTPAIGHDVLVIGNGNVALDLVRLLAKVDKEFVGSDLDPTRLAAIEACDVRQITVVGRGTPEVARFDPTLLRELGKLQCARIEIDDLPEGALIGQARNPVVTALAELHGSGPADAKCLVRFRFNLCPTDILGHARVEGIRFASSIKRNADVILEADTVITAIGFEDAEGSALRRAMFGPPESSLPVRLTDNLFAVGWFRRGARGTIPDNRRDGKEAAEAITATLQIIGTSKKPQLDLTELLAKRGKRFVNWSVWRTIAEIEERRAPPGRTRLKFATFDDLTGAIGVMA